MNDEYDERCASKHASRATKFPLPSRSLPPTQIRMSAEPRRRKGEPMGKTILVVDDDPITCEGLAAVLRPEGYSVVMALDSVGAMHYLSTEPAPDLVLLDMMMPGHDGWQFLNQWKHSRSHATIPVVIMTALGIASPEWAASLGAVSLLRKPF